MKSRIDRSISVSNTIRLSCVCQPTWTVVQMTRRDDGWPGEAPPTRDIQWVCRVRRIRDVLCACNESNQTWRRNNEATLRTTRNTLEPCVCSVLLLNDYTLPAPPIEPVIYFRVLCTSVCLEGLDGVRSVNSYVLAWAPDRDSLLRF